MTASRIGIGALLASAQMLAAGQMAARAEAAPVDRPVFARIFTEHAVLQRDRPIAVWGRAAPGAALVVRLADHETSVGLADHETRVTADRAGRWRATFAATPAGRGYRLSVSTDKATTTLEDIAVGDVYLCGGQSNMEFPARNATGAWGGFRDAANPDLRFVTIEKDNAPAPRDDLKTPVSWKVVTPETVGDASAACYFMARSLQASAKVPVGFIASDWGGTTIQSWTSGPALASSSTYAPGIAALQRYAADPAAGLAQEGRRQEAWWDAHDPAARAQRQWIKADFDDSSWATITPQGSWKDAGDAALAQFDGTVWFRTTVTFTEAQAIAAATLELGPIETSDTTWINGVRVGGGTTGWVWREYPIPHATLKPGRNVIAIRVLNAGAGGGFTGAARNRAIRMSSGELVPIDQTWRYHLGTRSKGLAATPAPWDVPTSLSTLYNGMIAPIAGYGLKLAAWYQGEANVGKAEEYRTLLPLLIADWRKTFGQKDLPFLVAQLSTYGSVATAPTESGWAEVRDVQAKVVRADPHAGLAVTVDVGDRSDIHPTQKMIVGERLAKAARAVTYGGTGSASGPEAAVVERRGIDLVVRFRDVTGGLRTYSADVAIGFEACAAQCRFVAGHVEGDAIVLVGGNKPDVTRVRYAWADAPYINLYDSSDLPAVPFELAVAP